MVTARAPCLCLKFITQLPDVSREEYYSTAIAILTIANIFAIIFAALTSIYDRQKHTPAHWLSGEGELVRKASFKTEDDEKAGQIAIVKRRLAWCYPPPPASCTGLYIYFAKKKIHLAAKHRSGVSLLRPYCHYLPLRAGDGF